MRLLSLWLQHQVTVEPYAGESAAGPVYGAPVVVRCWLNRQRRLVRTATGREATSSGTVYCRLGAVEAPPESRVTLPDGTLSTVIAQVPHDGGRLPLPDHLEIQLT